MATRALAVTLALLLLPTGFSCATNRRPPDPDTPDEGCSDLDGDGFGTGPDCAGPDCNDAIAEVHTEEQCAELCADDPMSPGCPCDAPEPEACYAGDPSTLGLGECRRGLSTCRDGIWGPCDGQVLPGEEVCDGLDNDCDGETDEGVLSTCGTCGECENDCTGPGEGCQPWGEDVSTGVAETPEGWLTLDGTVSSLHVIWPSSSASGAIYRVNTQTYEIEAAFWTGPGHGGGGWSGDSPSRSAVDDDGNVIIANRGFGGDGISSITKIAADPETCPDTNRNGRVDTSDRWDDKLDFDSHDDWEDECILWHTIVGGHGAVARGVVIHNEMALDGALVERGWVGLYMEARFQQFDPETGELTGIEAPTPGFSPYASAIDRDGWVWTASGAVGRFDTADPEDSFERVPMPMGSGVRVIVDENNVPWVSGTDVFRFDRDEWTFEPVGVGGFGASVGNLASDGRGSVWVATYRTGSHVYRIDNETLEYHQIATPSPNTFPMAVDFDNQAWTFSWTDGTATVIDLDTEETEHVLNDCAGRGCLETPYMRGDITGLQRRNALNPTGTWSRVVEGCEDGETDWKRLLVDSMTPAGTNLVVSVRLGDTLDEVNARDWRAVAVVPDDAGDIDLDDVVLDDARYLAVQVVLQSLDHRTAPTLRGVEVQWGCPISMH